MKKIKIGDMYKIKNGQFKGWVMRVAYRKGNILHLEGNHIKIVIKI